MQQIYLQMMMKWMRVRIFICFFVEFICFLCFSDELFGDYEDLETGEKSKDGKDNDDQMDFDDDDDDEGEGKSKETKLQAKKAKLKSAFDAEYDQSKDPDSGYLDELKKEVETQSKVLFLFFAD